MRMCTQIVYHFLFILLSIHSLLMANFNYNVWNGKCVNNKSQDEFAKQSEMCMQLHHLQLHHNIPRVNAKRDNDYSCFLDEQHYESSLVSRDRKSPPILS